MKKAVVLFIILFSFNFTNAQNDLTETEKLFATAKVWGFLKYYHPEVSKGKFDWDKELINNLPQILNSNSKEEFNDVLLKWINSLGIIKDKIKTEEAYNGINNNFDLSWVNNSKLFNTELSSVLKNVELNRNKGRKHYVEQNLNIGNVTIRNENDFPENQLSSYQYRLLGLYRYWNIVEYFFPYKYIADKNWDSVLMDYIPRFKNAETLCDYNLIFLKLISEVNDTHAQFISKCTNEYFGYYWLPVEYKVINNKVVIIGYYSEDLAKKNDLKIGDVIEKVDGMDAMELIDSNLKYIPASNISVKYRDAFTVLNSTKNNSNLILERNGEILSKDVKRYKFKDFDYKWRNPNPLWKKIEGNIGYINLGNLDGKDIPDIMERLRNTKTIILDLRNGAWRIFNGIGKYIKPERSPFAKILKPDLSYPGKYKFLETKNCCQIINEHYKGNIIILVNEYTQSHAEYTGMVFQSANNVTTIGSQTAGADGDVTLISLGGGYHTKLTGVGIFYPDGTETQRKGLKIDILVKPTLTGIRDGKDEVLEKAIEIANE